jgi:hypothetical protein
VIPSHPNFGFSGPAGRGLGLLANRQRLRELMARLGYDRYGAQGGDYGAFIAPDLGRVAPEHVVGVHVNAATCGFIPFGGMPEGTVLTDAEKVRLDRMQRFLAEGNGYFQLQASKPHTLGFALADSPVGQLAWIGEKFHDWAHPAGLDRRRPRAHPRDALLAHQHRCVVGAAVLRVDAHPALADPVRGAHRCGELRRGHRDPPVRRAAEQHHALGRVRRGRPLRRARVPHLFTAEVRTFFRTVR